MPDPKTAPTCYEIRVEGHLPPHWSDWFDGLTVRPGAGDETLISGAVADQAALFGLLKKVRDLGLSLLSIRRIPFREDFSDHPNQE